MLLSIRPAHWKFVEHALGLGARDDMLKRTADLLCEVFQGDSVIGRWNADEFVVLSVVRLGRFNLLLRLLSDRIDAANSSPDTLHLALSGRFRVLALPSSTDRELRFDLVTLVQEMKAATGEFGCHV
jgi:GGDEF domain-containing protein